MPQTLIAPDRRTALAALAGFLAGPALPVTAATANPDAELLVLAARFSAAWQVSREANARADECEMAARKTRPPVPDALRRAGDARFFGRCATGADGPEFYNVAECIGFRERVPFGPRVLTRDQREACRSRAAEIVAAYEQWDADIGRHDEVCGLVAADARADAAYDAACAIGQALMEMVPVTLPGLIAKARVADAMQLEGQVDRIFNDLLALGAEA